MGEAQAESFLRYWGGLGGSLEGGFVVMLVGMGRKEVAMATRRM